MKITFIFDDYRLDILQQRLYKGGERIVLFPMEVRLLIYLASHAETIVSPEELHREVLMSAYTRESNPLFVQMSRLRAGMGDKDHKLIESVFGEHDSRRNTDFQGFKLNAKVQIIAEDLPPGSRIARGGRPLYQVPGF